MNLTRLSQAGLILTACVALTACMTPQQQNAQEYNVAKKNFDQQNYRAAFHSVQAPARNGNADAQYALGYMYFYGKGTVIDPQKARYWFQQAAKQGQGDAQRALQAMPRPTYNGNNS